MSAKKLPQLASQRHRKKLIAVCLAIVCALVAVGLYAWQSQPVPEAGASVTTAEGKSRQEIQDELDAIVRDNMMTISGKARRISKSRHSTPRPMTTTAIRRASRSGWNRPRTNP